ncbi:hypothetical protein MNBD_GAMMA21-1988 [hydrothermal vent metagenome]|uniref:Uncharacterized protein n=1 Tax=hydrothermal vent metagenome TaxID=652676 RepID=A0A3B1AST0_9ZZZZ
MTRVCVVGVFPNTDTPPVLIYEFPLSFLDLEAIGAKISTH